MSAAELKEAIGDVPDRTLRNYGEEKSHALAGELLGHAASSIHPMAWLLLNLLPKVGVTDGSREAIQRTLTSALLDPQIYNRVAGAAAREPSLLSGLAMPARMAATRSAMVAVPRGIGPALTRTQ